MNGFIIGKIGGSEVVKEDLKSFLNKTKEVDWTTNSIYKAASCAEVKPTFSSSKKEEESIISKYDLKNVESCFVDTSKLQSYLDFNADQEKRNINIIDKIALNRENIMNLSYNSTNQAPVMKQDILNQLKTNWKKTILNNKELSNTLAPFKGWLTKTVNDY